MAIQQQIRQKTKHTLPWMATCMMLASSFFSPLGFPPPSGPGYILDGSNSILNPDGGSYMSNQLGDGSWTVTTEEFQQFEEIAGIGGANSDWQSFPNAGLEPTGLEDSNDIQSGGNCGNTDITTDSNGGEDYGYFAIIDQDGIAGNGDEILALALRIADEVNGSYSFSFLLDADNDCGSDPNEVCGNPCFEYEIQISTNKTSVTVINIDGCSGAGDCDAAHGTPATSGKAFVCNPCNKGALQVLAGSGACPSSSLDPVFWMAHIPFSDLSGVSPVGDFRLVPASSTSGNSIIYKSSNVSDYGGLGDPNLDSGCDCDALCGSSSCGDCIRDCALACGARTGSEVLPLEWLDVSIAWENNQAKLTWNTAPGVDTDLFEIERMNIDRTFATIGQLMGSGNSTYSGSYTFTDTSPETEQPIYRVKQVEYDGTFSYSRLVELAKKGTPFGIKAYADPSTQRLQLTIQSDNSRSVQLRIISLNGAIQYEKEHPLGIGSPSFSISTAGFSRGVYLIQVTDQTTGETTHLNLQL